MLLYIPFRDVPGSKDMAVLPDTFHLESLMLHHDASALDLDSLSIACLRNKNVTARRKEIISRR